MKKILFIFVLTFATIGLSAQSKKGPTDKAITQLMHVKKGMVSVNGITNELAEKIEPSKEKAFRAEMDTFRGDMINNAMKTFKADYTASEIDAIYKECTSDKIDYTDLTNTFFAKWRRLKGEFFKHAKETYFKYH